MTNVMDAHVLKRLFSVDEFHQMAEAGVFRDDDRLELLDGEIVRMTPIGSPHAACVMRLNEWFSTHLREAAIVGVQGPLVLDDNTEFYPDVALLRRRSDFYSKAHPRGQDVLLVVEVADTTVAYDRKIKVPRYARAGVSEVWVVDLPARAIHVYDQPATGAYRRHRQIEPGQSLTVPGLRDPQFAVSDLFERD